MRSEDGEKTADFPTMLPLVFFPGAGGRAGFWRPVADRLTDVGLSVLMAWPGFGDQPSAPGIDSVTDLYRWTLPSLPAERFHLIAQSMGGLLAVLVAIEHPTRVATLTLCATSGGVNVSALGGKDWRPAYRAELPDVPDWFERDRTDLTARLVEIQAPTLVLNGDRDPISPPAVARRLCECIPRSRAEVLAGGDHDFANAYPNEVAAAIRRHITDWS